MNYFFYLYDMKVIIWIKTEDFNDFVDGKNVKYWTNEPFKYGGVNPDTVSIIIDTDRYQQLIDSEDVG